MKKTTVSQILITAALLGVCSVSVVAEDGLTPGPGIFSGDKGEFSLSKLLQVGGKEVEKTATEVAAQPVQPVTQPKEKAQVSTTDKLSSTTELSEFQLYKEWRQFKADGSGDYREFQQWLEYKAFIESAK